MLKRYYAREEDHVEGTSTQVSEDVTIANTVAKIDDTEDGNDDFGEGISFPFFNKYKHG